MTLGRPQAPACIACSKAKRRCGREIPSCRRCRIRHAPCTYPSPSPSRVSPTQTSREAPLTPPNDHAQINRATPLETRQISSPSALSAPSAQQQQQPGLPWFLSPSAWDVDHVPVPEDARCVYPTSGVEYFVDKMKTWFDQWASENQCPIIHPRLYGSDLPNPLQSALATWITYRAAVTPTSSRIALQMAKDWSQALVDTQSVPDLFESNGPCLITHLSRTQSLLLFELICLFDGDVASRAHGELILPVLVNWVDALFRKAKIDASAEHFLDPEALLNQPSITQLATDGTHASKWRAWILSESIRRTWIAASLLNAAFGMMKDVYTVCPGSIIFTLRTGLWSAAGPREWLLAIEKESSVKEVVSCRRLDTLYTTAKPSDVDEFGQALLAYSRGQEALEDWLGA